jgi:hypothetical protein
MPVTRRKSDADLSESLRHDADAGPVIMPSYTLLSKEDWDRLLDLIDGKIARHRRAYAKPDEEGVSIDEVIEKCGL